jgi:excisionase family DNA binding protein
VNLSLYCDVAEACRICGVSDGYMRRLIREGKVAGHRFGNSYAVLRESAAAFIRQPGMGRPRKRSTATPKQDRQPSKRRKPRRK